MALKIITKKGKNEKELDAIRREFKYVRIIIWSERF